MLIRLRERLRREDGFAMIYALGIIGLTMVIGSVAAAYAMSQSHFTGRDAQRVQAIPAAEAGIDVAYENIQAATSNLTAGTTTLPCSSNGTSPAVTGTLSGTGPTPSTYSVTIQYYNSYPPSGTATTTCPISTSAQSAVISATGNVPTPFNVSRTMEALVQISPIQGRAFDKALFANSGLSTGNQLTVDGYQGDDANVYSNSNWTCANNEMVYGSVIVQGSITANNTCSAAVDFWATGNITTTNASSIGHDVLSSGGNINLAGNTTVGDSALAAGTNNCGFHYTNQCVSNSTVAVPPTQNFPAYPATTESTSSWLTDWQNSGYTIVQDNTCTNSGVYQDITNAATVTTPEVIYTTCALSFSGSTNITLNNNLALISTGGFSFGNKSSIAPSSTATTPLNFYMIVPCVPASTVTNGNPCSNTNVGITAGQNFSVSSSIDTFMYTPGPVTYTNLNVHYGQIYGGGTVTINNNMTLSYVPMTVPGSPPTNANSYQVNIAYERETCPGLVGGSC